MTSSARVGGMRVGKKDPRHRAREVAVQVLYQWEVGRGTIDQAVDTVFTLQWPDEGPPPRRCRRLPPGLRATRSPGSNASTPSLPKPRNDGASSGCRCSIG